MLRYFKGKPQTVMYFGLITVIICIFIGTLTVELFESYDIQSFDLNENISKESMVFSLIKLDTYNSTNIKLTYCITDLSKKLTPTKLCLADSKLIIDGREINSSYENKLTKSGILNEIYFKNTDLKDLHNCEVVLIINSIYLKDENENTTEHFFQKPINYKLNLSN